MRQAQERERGKGKTPKEEMSCQSNLGHAVKNCMTVIRFYGWGAIGETLVVFTPALYVSAFLHDRKGFGR